MARTRSMTSKKNDDDDASSSRKRSKTCDIGSVRPWSDLNHHLLYLIMMQLGVVDYLFFRGVCKSWRSLALSERNKFLASKPPMTMRICWGGGKIKSCYLEDFEGRNFKTIPPFLGGTYVGLTCGYLIFFRKTPRDILLVNPITRHELYFTNVPTDYLFPLRYPKHLPGVRAILVFSRSIREYVFLIMLKHSDQIWFSVAGTGTWNNLTCTSRFTGLRAFKGKIYTLNNNLQSRLCELYELRLTLEPKLTLLETNNSLKASEISELVSSDVSLYVMDRVPPDMNTSKRNRYMFQQLDFGEMKWVSHEKIVGEYASFLSDFKHGIAVTPELCGTRRQGLLLGHNRGVMLKLIEVETPGSSFCPNMWYFLHECFSVDLVDG